MTLRHGPARARACAFAAAGLAVTMLLSIPARAEDATSAEWDKVVAAAKKEGTLVFYNGSSVNEPRAVTKRFEEKYGIRVATVEGTVSAIRERVRSEIASGRTLGDVHLSGITTGAQLRAAGFYMPHGGLPNMAKLKRQFVPEAGRPYFATVRIGRFAILVNSDQVKPADEPKSWLDLLDPKWKGKMLSGDPRTGGSAQVSYTVFYDKWGREYLDKLAKQDLTFASNTQIMERRVAQGEFPIDTTMAVSDIPTLHGLPVKAITPKEGSTYVITVAAMLKGAPHPNAARLFLNFYMSDEAQNEVSRFGADSPTGVVSPQMPAYMKPLIDQPLFGTADPFKLDDMVKLFEQVWGKR